MAIDWADFGAKVVDGINNVANARDRVVALRDRLRGMRGGAAPAAAPAPVPVAVPAAYPQEQRGGMNMALLALVGVALVGGAVLLMRRA